MSLIPLRLAPRSPAGTAEPPALSPARQALHDHRDAQRAQLDHLAVMGAPCREAQASAERVKQARAALDSIEQDERRELDARMTAPKGALPPTLNERRNAALLELATAERALSDAQRRATAAEPAFRVEEAKLHNLNRETPALIDAVLVELAHEYAERLRAAKLEVAALLGLWRGVYDAGLLNQRSAVAVAAVHAWRGGKGELLDEQRFRQTELDTAERHRVAALGLLERLKADPAASIEIDAGPLPTDSPEAA